MSAVPTPTVSPAEAWRLLAAGNDRFVAGSAKHPHRSAWRRGELVAGQRPVATVLSCSDSRVPPELIFDRGLGDLFVVRTAGHVVDEAALGSIEYGVTVVGTPLLVVLGHEHCGCIAATMQAVVSGVVPDGAIGALVRAVLPVAQSAMDLGVLSPGEVMEEHVRATMRLLLEESPAIAGAVAGGELALAGLTYRLQDGRASLLDWAGDLGQLTDLEEIVAQASAALRQAEAVQALGQATPVADPAS